jgi:GNAT superfamily N-acetyltransferase
MGTPSVSERTSPRVTLHPFSEGDLPALVSLWNHAFADRHNYVHLTADAFHQRVLSCPAYGDGGLILAWHQTGNNNGREPSSKLVGFIHGFKPPPHTGQYVKWKAEHHIAMLYVDPLFRRQGIGGRLLQAAENWLYYCPVHITGDTMPCYGTIEGPTPPFFGSTERLSIAADETELLHFFAGRGYAIHDAGDVSMSLNLERHRPQAPEAIDESIDLDKWGLSLRFVDNAHPFDGDEPPGRSEYALWGDNDGYPYAALILVDAGGLLRGHISWYPIPSANIMGMDSAPTQHAEAIDYAGDKIGLSHFWLSPDLRGKGFGAYLLDMGLHAMSLPNPNFAGLHDSGPRNIELNTHLLHNEKAVALYERRGFQIEKAWVKLVKT